jgi:DNA-directed RNA polymerase specialized sigma subunit
METTRPLLIIDLSKAMSKAQAKAVHKELPPGGQWRTMNGHHIYIKDGKVLAGAVPTSDGKGAKKATKAHLSEHQATIDAEAKKAKSKKVKATASKSKATKEANKTNATGKTGGAKLIVDATAAPKKTTKKKASEAPKVEEKPKKAPAAKKKACTRSRTGTCESREAEEDAKSESRTCTGADQRRVKKPAAKKKPAPAPAPEPVKAEKPKKAPKAKAAPVPKPAPAPEVKKPAKAKKEPKAKVAAAPAPAVASEEPKTLQEHWDSDAVKSIMSQPKDKRDPEQVKDVAGKMTTDNDKLARKIVISMAASRGLSILGQFNKTGNTKQETNLYGDLLQTARMAMYETLHAVLSGTQNPGTGTAIAAHVITRMKDKLNKGMHEMLNDIPVSEELKPVLGDMSKAETELTQKLGRTPTEKEVAEHLQATSKAFQSASIVKPPEWDEAKGQFVDKKQKYKDPLERYQAMKAYAAVQKTTSADKNVGSAGEKEVSLSDSMSDKTASTIEEGYEDKEYKAELEDRVPKLLKEMGVDDSGMKVFDTMFSSASEASNKPQLTMKETTEKINEQGGIDGSPVTQKWVEYQFAKTMKHIQQKIAENHPAAEQLKRYWMKKSLMANLIMKALYQMELIKSLGEWGVDLTVLEERYSRTASAESLMDLRKSMEPQEGIGSYVTLDDGTIIARLVEISLPESHDLYKAFNDFAMDLQKSMFPHVASSNHALNQKASEYVKANKGKYKAMQDDQHARIGGKSGGLTWSEQLQKDKGGVWITWGGKKILINGESGEILYDSHNEVHREEHNNGAQADKIDFHHEQEAGVTKDNAHEHDEGIKAFKAHMEDMRKDWKENIKPASNKAVKHKTAKAYEHMDEEKRKAMDALPEDERDQHYGEHILEHSPKSSEALKAAFDEIQEKTAGKKPKEAGKIAKEVMADHLPGIQALGKEEGVSSALIHKGKMETLAGEMAGMKDFSEVAKMLGKHEIGRGNDIASQKMLPEGAFMVGNPVTGKTMVVRFTHGFGGDGGNTAKTGWTTKIAEVFDPEGGKHEDDLETWGGLGRALGVANPNNLQETLVIKANTDADKPFMKQLSDDEYNDMRSKTKAGLQESMLHKEFKLVDEQRDDDGNLTSRTYAQKMPDGTTNHITTDADGMIKDPLMQRLLNQRRGVNSEAEVNKLLKDAVGNRSWVTAHFGSDIHVGDALGHHVQLEYDGKGAPRVVSGPYAGYRYIDSKQVPKGATDPATGEPVKALFRNGKLVDRKFSTKNDVAMKEGNAVMYPDADGKMKKGRIHSIEGGNVKVTDGKGHVIGMFKQNELKNATEKGRTLSNSGQAVVRLGQSGVHRINTSEAFNGESPKAKQLFAQALTKAGIKTAAFDAEGNLKDDIELKDPAMKRLQKVLGRSKAGKAMLAKIDSTQTPHLELHVPESLREQVEHSGVAVGADGKAKISTGKFEELRNVLGGLSIDNKAQAHLADHFARKDRKPKTPQELQTGFQPANVKTKNPKFDAQYKAQFKSDSFLMDPKTGLYGTQLEGVSHLVERKNAIVGHGMGVGKTITGVVAALHHKANELANGGKPKKTLIVAPKGIMSDWGKEIGKHTNSSAMYIGSGLSKKDADGNVMKDKDGRKLWGQDKTEQHATDFKSFKANMDKHASEGHDFHIVSYDTYMNNHKHFTGSGMYDNVIIDEVHAFKNAGGKRGKSLAESTSKFSNVWGLSGTPMENDAREVYSLVNTITGGKHELGSEKEFQNKYMKKDKNGKLVGVKSDMAEKLGDILANVVQFRGGQDVTYSNGDKIKFPHLEGAEGTKDNPNPKSDFMGNMVDGSRDHKTTEYYGTKHSVTDYDTHSPSEVEGAEGAKVTMTAPKNLDPVHQAMYDKYNELQQKYLPESKLKELSKAAATGYDQGQKGSQNYLTAMQKLQKFLNAPLSHKMYVPGGNAFDSSETDAQGTGKKGKGKGEAIPHTLDSDGNKRYYESDGNGGYLKNEDGSPKLLPPMHHENPKAQYLQKRINQYLDGLQKENAERVKNGQVPMVPKLVVKSSYTQFGTDIVDGVLKDIRKTHPIFDELEKQGHKNLGQGRFTGDADDREETKVGFRGNKDDYANDQGNLWATTVSPAGKEGVDFGNAHAMFHYDQDWNPQKMAQFTARVRRSDSAKSHAAMGRANSVRVESLHMPGTIEDFMFNAQDAKMRDIKEVTDNTRTMEKNPKLGETEGKIGYGHAGFTSGAKKTVGAKPKGAKGAPKAPETPTAKRAPALPKQAVASASKGMKLVILL